MDDLVSQVHMLETSKMKLELEITQMKKDFRREIQTKEDDLEDIRLANNKKVKVLEAQLEQEHEERMGQVRDKHELEAKVQSLQDLLDRSGDEEVLTKLRRDLKRTKALLKDAQMYMEKNQSDGTNKVIVRQLKNQVFIIVNTLLVNGYTGHWFLVAAGGRRVRPVLRHQGEAELGAGAGGCADTAGRCHEVGISQSQLSISVTMDQSGASTRWRRGTCGSPGRRPTWPAASPSSRRSSRRCGWLPLENRL